MDIIAIAVALKKAISQTKDIIASHFVAGTNIEITDNPDGTQTISASGEVSATDEVARQTISDHKANLNNPHSVTKNQVGLGNVDNTSDVDKPISTATQAALNGKQPTISDLATIRSNATAGAGAAEVVAGIDKTGNNYIEMKSGQREYLSTTVPTGNIPLGSVGMGWAEGVYTFKSGTRIGEGVPTANLFDKSATVDTTTLSWAAIYTISGLDTSKSYTLSTNYVRPSGAQAASLYLATSTSVSSFADGVWSGVSKTKQPNEDGTLLVIIRMNQGYTDAQPIYNDVLNGTVLVMLNEGSTPLPYVPYGAKKISFYANGQPLADYTIYGATGGVGDATSNEFTGDISQFDNQGGTGSTYEYFKLTGDYTMTLICKGDCTTPSGATIGLNADGGVVTGGYTTLVAQRGNYTQGQVITGITSDNGYQYVYIYGGSTTLEWIMEHFDIMLNKGNTALPYEPYGYKIPVICGGQTTNIYLDSPLGANDSIDYTTSQVNIPTVDGANSLICDTTVQPSKVSLTYTGWHSDLDDTTARLEALENAPAPSGMTYDTLYEGTTASSYPYPLAHEITNYKFIIIAVGYSNVYTNNVIPVAVWSTVTSGGGNYDITVDTAQLRVNASEIVPRSANNRIVYGIYGIK